MTLIIRHLVFILFSGFALSLQAETTLANHRSLLVLGDSLSAAYGITPETGWVHLLQEKLQSDEYHYQVVNASISGETSGGGLSSLENLLQTHQPEILLIALGANDGLRGFPIKILKQNLQAMIDLGTHYQCKILLVGIQIPLNYGPRYTNLFEQAYIDIAQANNLHLLPSLLGDIPLKREYMQADGLHPTEQAQPLILSHLWPSLQPLLSR